MERKAPERVGMRVKGNDLTRWVIAVLLIVLLFFGIWRFLNRSRKTAPNHPGAVSELIDSSARLLS